MSVHMSVRNTFSGFLVGNDGEISLKLFGNIHNHIKHNPEFQTCQKVVRFSEGKKNNKLAE